MRIENCPIQNGQQGGQPSSDVHPDYFAYDDMIGYHVSFFQYILGAATSPAVKMNEETLTYLNQGQSYEIKLKKLGDLSEYQGKCLRSVLKVLFHERRLQYMEREQMEQWKMTRPGERILDVDIPLSYGLVDFNLDTHKINQADFIWDPTKETGLYFKVHAISTEFTAKKHGGEKGVPFRIQVETYSHGEGESKLLHAASCQIKVFKPKGADRKHKTDREKMEKRSDAEKEKFQPSYECTVLTEVPVEQVMLSQNSFAVKTGSSQSLSSSFSELSYSVGGGAPGTGRSCSQQGHYHGAADCGGKVCTDCCYSSVAPWNANCNAAYAYPHGYQYQAGFNSSQHAANQQHPGFPTHQPNFSFGVCSQQNFTSEMCSEPSFNSGLCSQLNFSSGLCSQQNFSSEMCSEPSFSFGLCSQQNISSEMCSQQNFSSEMCSQPNFGSALCSDSGYNSSGASWSSANSDSSSNSSNPNSCSSSVDLSCSMELDDACTPTDNRCSGTPGSTTASSPHPNGTTPVTSTPSRQVPDSVSHTTVASHSQQPPPHHPHSAGPTSPTPSASGDSKAFVGQSLIGEATAQEVQNWLAYHRFSNYTRIFQNFSGADLLRLSRDDLIQICGLADGIRLDNALQSKSVRPRLTIFICQEPESVYHAVYMDIMAVEELKCKLAQLFGIQAGQIGDIFMLGPSSIHIMVTDEVLRNTPDQARFVVEGMREESGDKYRILLKSM